MHKCASSVEKVEGGRCKERKLISSYSFLTENILSNSIVKQRPSKKKQHLDYLFIGCKF